MRAVGTNREEASVHQDHNGDPDPDLRQQLNHANELVDKLAKQLVDAKTELRLQAAIKQEAADLNGPLPAELLHAMHSAGPTTVWVPLGHGREVLALVSGSAERDNAAERAVYRHLVGKGDAGSPVASVGHLVQSMPARLLGWSPRGEVVVNSGLGRYERGVARKRLAISLRARRRARSWRVAALAPAALTLVSVRAIMSGARDVAVNAAVTMGPTLATATAAATFVAAVSTSPAVSSSVDSPRRERSVSVADDVPAVTATPSPSPSSPGHAAVRPPVHAPAKAAPPPTSAPPDPAPDPDPDPAPDPAAPTPGPDPGPPAEVIPEPTPPVIPPADPPPTEPASPPAAAPGDPPADAPTEPPMDPAVPGVTPGSPATAPVEPVTPSPDPVVLADTVLCLLGALADGALTI